MKQLPYAYHSAQLPELTGYPPLAQWLSPRGTALTWDVAVERALPREFDACDVFYVEPPFPDGWKEFYGRLRQDEPMPYMKFIQRIGGYLQWRPGVVILGKLPARLLRYDWRPEAQHFMALHESFEPDQQALWFGIRPERMFYTAQEIITYLAEHYGCVGDFCCGYGNTGRIFAEHGKRFVLSDINPRCVGYIAEQEWAK